MHKPQQTKHSSFLVYVYLILKLTWQRVFWIYDRKQSNCEAPVMFGLLGNAVYHFLATTLVPIGCT